MDLGKMFFEDDGSSPKKAKKAPPKATETPETGLPPTKAFVFTASSPAPAATRTATATGISQEDLDRFRQHFQELFEKANLPGPDYFEFSQVKRKLQEQIPDEKTQITAAFASLSIQGLTKDILVSSAQHYIDIIQKDREGFEQAIASKQNTEVDGRNKKISGLQKLITDNNEQIQLLTKAITQSQSDIKALQDAGVTSFDCWLFGPTLGETVDKMRRFRDDVVAKVR